MHWLSMRHLLGRRPAVPVLIATIVAVLASAVPGYTAAPAGLAQAAPAPAGLAQAALAAAGTPAALTWGACPPPPPGYPANPRVQCARLEVPLDYRHPGGRKIGIAVSRIPAADPASRRGVLLSNPGGPGGSGLALPLYLAQALPAAVVAHYDLIGFDPRGVADSTPITCGIPEQTPASLVLPYPAPDGSIERNVDFGRRTARSCAQQAGDLLPFITTANTARDMDSIRAALREPKISYLGYSYGTYLGAVYASLFPGRGDRIILDSAVDPNLIWYDMWRTWGQAIALRLPDFTRWAAARDEVYRLGATAADVERTYFRTAERLDRDPIEVAPGVIVDGNLYRELTRSLLYGDENFPALAAVWQALGDPATGMPAELVRTRLAASAVAADNSVAVLYAITCGDTSWPRQVATYQRNVAEDRRTWPATAGMPANLWPCAFWPTRPIEPPVAVTSNGPRNILILQNLRDPATSWVSGYGLRRALDRRAAMVTQDAGGHGIFGIRAGACVIDIATRFLVDGALPNRDRFCDGPSPEDPFALTTTGRLVPSGPLGVG